MRRIKVSDKIELRQIEIPNTSAFFQLINKNRDYLRQWLGWLDVTKTTEDLEKFIASTLAAISEKKALCYLIWAEDKIVGIIHLRDIDFSNKKAMIGYWVGEEFRGKGLARMATKTVVDYAFRELKLNRIEIRCAPGNKASQSIPKKLGFKEEGLLRDNEWLYDHFVDHVVFSTLARDWRS